MNGALANSLIPLPFQLLCGYLLFALTFMPCFYGSIKKNFFLKNTVEYITCEALKPDKMSQTFSQRVDRYAVLNCFVCSNESKTLFFFHFSHLHFGWFYGGSEVIKFQGLKMTFTNRFDLIGMACKDWGLLKSLVRHPYFHFLTQYMPGSSRIACHQTVSSFHSILVLLHSDSKNVACPVCESFLMFDLCTKPTSRLWMTEALGMISK